MRKNVLVFALLILAVTGLALPAGAQDGGGCQVFRAVVSAQVPSPYTGLNPPDIWGGSVFASLGSPGAQEPAVPLVGAFSGADGEEDQRKFGGMAMNGAYTLAFGDPSQPWESYEDKFTIALGRAVWNIRPGQNIGDYQASGRITKGQGRFAGATGTVTIHGPFFFNLALFLVRWNPEINGTICLR
jgi:hypothetical protein